MKILKILYRLSNLVVIAVLFLAAGGYMAMERVFATTGVLDTRSIQLSTSANAANNDQLKVAFNVGTTGNIGSMAIDFCSEDPIPGDTCTAPTSMDVNKSTIGNPTSQVGITDWVISTANSTTKCILLTRTAASVSAATTVTFTMGNGTTTGILNPANTNTSFYARMLTYATTVTTCDSHTMTSYVDAGGIALSTTAALVITSKVQEQLSLCIYTGANCGAGGTAITLGDANGILSTGGSYTNITGKFTASTNAASGMNIYAKGSTLTSAQANTIAAIAAGNSTGTTSAAGTEQFGFCIFTSGGSVSPAAPYNDGSCSSVTTGLNLAGSAVFAFDTTSTPNMTTLGGMKVASSNAPSTTTTGTIAYLANIGVTTKAGVYTTTQTFVGIGVF